VDGAGVAVFLALAAAIDRHVDAVIAENAQQLLDVGQMRHVFERQRIAGQQRGDHQRQGGILGAGNRNDAIQLITADNSDTIHGRLRAMPAFLKLRSFKRMRVFRRNPRRLQFEADGTLRFVHFCGRQPICLIRLAGTAGARLLFAAREVFPQFFRGPVTTQFRLLFDRGFAAVLRVFSVFGHAKWLIRIRGNPKVATLI
jgi:hypothetical protein